MLTTFLSLVLPLLCLRFMTGWRPAPWKTGPDLALLLGAGVGGGLLSGLWLADFALVDGNLSASPDFWEYCGSTAALAADQVEHFSHNRSRLAGWLPGRLAPTLGIEDALLVSAFASTIVLCCAAALWGRAAHSRLAGVASALLVGAVAPLAVLPRTLTFYPEILAGLLLCSATGLVALRWRTPVACLAAGVGAGIALLIDARGLIWALTAVGLGALAAIWGPSRRWHPRGLPLRVAALVLPLWISFVWGPWAYGHNAQSLEGITSPLRELRDRGLLDATVSIPPEPPTRFIWGRTPLSGIPGTLRTVAAMQDHVPEAARQTREAQRGRAWWVDPWRPVVWGALVVVIVGLRRKPVLLIGMLGLMLPCALSLDSASGFKRAKPRFLANAMLVLPPLLGVAAAVLAHGAPGRTVLTHGHWRRLALGVGVVVVMLLGIWPSWLGPDADWRVPLQRNDRALQQARDNTTADAQGDARARCAAAIAAGPERRLTP